MANFGLMLNSNPYMSEPNEGSSLLSQTEIVLILLTNSPSDEGRKHTYSACNLIMGLDLFWITPPI